MVYGIYAMPSIITDILVSDQIMFIIKVLQQWIRAYALDYLVLNTKAMRQRSPTDVTCDTN